MWISWMILQFFNMQTTCDMAQANSPSPAKHTAVSWVTVSTLLQLVHLYQILSQIHAAQSNVLKHSLTHKTPFLFHWMAFMYLKREKALNIEFWVVCIHAVKILDHLNGIIWMGSKYQFFWNTLWGTVIVIDSKLMKIGHKLIKIWSLYVKEFKPSNVLNVFCIPLIHL